MITRSIDQHNVGSHLEAVLCVPPNKLFARNHVPQNTHLPCSEAMDWTCQGSNVMVTRTNCGRKSPLETWLGQQDQPYNPP